MAPFIRAVFNVDLKIDCKMITKFCFITDPLDLKSMERFKRQLVTSLPELRERTFKIQLKDNDSDLIEINDDWDLAFLKLEGPCQTLCVTVENRSMNFAVYCDICKKSIGGYRYKCLQCVKFDLCSVCEIFLNHPDHFVLRIPTPDINSRNNWARIMQYMTDLVNQFGLRPYNYNIIALFGMPIQEFEPPKLTPEAFCDVCKANITSFRYKCLQCVDYDLCGNCERRCHHSEHLMLRISKPEMTFRFANPGSIITWNNLYSPGPQRCFKI